VDGWAQRLSHESLATVWHAPLSRSELALGLQSLYRWADVTDVEIREKPPAWLDEYARIPSAFEVCAVLELSVRNEGLGGFEFRERQVSPPFVKDYDAIPGNHPSDWKKRFDLADWGLLAAQVDDHCVGGAVVAFGTHEVHMLEGRNDLAVLWDIRVDPHVRRSGCGSALFAAAARWARARGCRWLKIETQNINVPACRFYARHGCTLGAVHRFAYPELPEEVQLLWYKDLT
jgi:GNAT superfamily N-acetyltransferase